MNIESWNEVFFKDTGHLTRKQTKWLELCNINGKSVQRIYFLKYNKPLH